MKNGTCTTPAGAGAWQDNPKIFPRILQLELSFTCYKTLTPVHSSTLNLPCLSPHPVPKQEKLPQHFSERSYSKCKEHTKWCFSNAIHTWYQHLFVSPPYIRNIHTFKENSCLGPHKYLMYYMLSCTSLSIRSFKLFHVTIYQCYFWQCHFKNFLNFIHLKSWYLFLQTKYLYFQTRQLH